MEDPQIEYERALGMFLVRFNRVEQCVSWLIEEAFRRANMESLGLRLSAESFVRKVETLALIGRDQPRFSHGLEGRLKQLAQVRNKLAHGDVNLDPMLEQFRVALKIEHPVAPDKIPQLIDEAEGLEGALMDVLGPFYLEEPVASPAPSG